MDFAGGGLRESSVTDRALVGSFPCVYPDVLLQAGFLGEVLSARVAPVGRYHLKKM